MIKIISTALICITLTYITSVAMTTANRAIDVYEQRELANTMAKLQIGILDYPNGSWQLNSFTGKISNK